MTDHGKGCPCGQCDERRLALHEAHCDRNPECQQARDRGDDCTHTIGREREFALNCDRYRLAKRLGRDVAPFDSLGARSRSIYRLRLVRSIHELAALLRAGLTPLRRDDEPMLVEAFDVVARDTEGPPTSAYTLDVVAMPISPSAPPALLALVS